MSESNFMHADKELEKDLMRAATPDEIRELLHAAVARSPQLGVERDIQTGRYVSRRDPLTPAHQDAAAEKEDKVFSKTVTISGKEFTFTDESEQGLTNQIASAQVVAENLVTDAQAVEPAYTAQRVPHAALDAVRKAELELQFKRGEIDTATYLRESGALAEALAQSGFDIEAAATKQFESNWAAATDEFLHSQAGRDWPGGQENLQIMGMTLTTLGLQNNPSAESLAKAYQYMREHGIVQSTEPTEQEMLDATAKMTPTEIIQAWKQEHAGQDASEANAAFLETFQHGRLHGGLFDR